MLSVAYEVQLPVVFVDNIATFELAAERTGAAPHVIVNVEAAEVPLMGVAVIVCVPAVAETTENVTFAVVEAANTVDDGNAGPKPKPAAALVPFEFTAVTPESLPLVTVAEP